MKKFWKMIVEDYRKEDFTADEWIMCGLVLPLLLIAIMGIAGWMDHLSGLV